MHTRLSSVKGLGVSVFSCCLCPHSTLLTTLTLCLLSAAGPQQGEVTTSNNTRYIGETFNNLFCFIPVRYFLFNVGSLSTIDKTKSKSEVLSFKPSPKSPKVKERALNSYGSLYSRLCGCAVKKCQHMGYPVDSSFACNSMKILIDNLILRFRDAHSYLVKSYASREKMKNLQNQSQNCVFLGHPV